MVSELDYALGGNFKGRFVAKIVIWPTSDVSVCGFIITHLAYSHLNHKVSPLNMARYTLSYLLRLLTIMLAINCHFDIILNMRQEYHSCLSLNLGVRAEILAEPLWNSVGNNTSPCALNKSYSNGSMCTASRMSYLCSTTKKYCVSLWEFYVVGPQSGRDDVRPRGNEQPAECVRRRPSMCFVGDSLFTAVLIPMLGGYLLVDDTLASWSGHVTTTAVLIHQLGEHEHRPISGGTSRLDGDRPTLGWTIHNTLVGWLVLLLTWAIHSLVGATFESDTHLLTITWAIHKLVGATLHTLKLLLLGRYISCFKLFTDLKACLQISVHAFEKVYVTQGPLSSL